MAQRTSQVTDTCPVVHSLPLLGEIGWYLGGEGGQMFHCLLRLGVLLGVWGCNRTQPPQACVTAVRCKCVVYKYVCVCACTCWEGIDTQVPAYSCGGGLLEPATIAIASSLSCKRERVRETPTIHKQYGHS